MTSSGIAHRWQGPRRNPARSALGFAALHFGLILVCVALAPTSDILAYRALADTFPSAMAEAVTGLGALTVRLLVVSFKEDSSTDLIIRRPPTRARARPR